MKINEIVSEARTAAPKVQLTPEEIYNDFQLVRQMKSSMWTKIRIGGELLAQYPHHWRVVGITAKALQRFKENDFRKTSGMKINRAHKVDRAVWLKELLTKEMSFEQFWQYYQINDQTVLATSEENMNKSGVTGWSKVYSIDQALDLFKSSGFAWKHNGAERNFLMMLDQVNKNLAQSSDTSND